jgi:hypothetical protein
MGINQTIEKIEQTAKLKVLGVRKIWIIKKYF